MSRLLLRQGSAESSPFRPTTHLQRAEQSLKVHSLLREALDNILYHYKSIESKLFDIDQQIKDIKHSLNNGAAKAGGRE